MVVTESGTIRAGGRELPALTANLLAPGVDPGAGARAMLDGFTSSGLVVFVVDGPNLRIEYDRKRHCGISPEDLEAALQAERAEDAEELRRLGAVEPGL